MCGILGVRRSSALASNFEAALKALEWRGPDGLFQTTSGDWLLGIARLAITDPESPQPIDDGERVVVFNGAITSASDDWASVGRDAVTRNDAELILARLREEGPGGLLRLVGPHAFAVHDRGADTFWFGRDDSGEKPLWVVDEGDEPVAFASTPAALRALGVTVELGERDRCRFLRFGYQPRTTTLRRLEPGEVSEAFNDVLERGHGEHSVDSREFETVFGDAVARCAETEVPAALTLSGGIDSACIAVSLRERGFSLPAYQFRAVGEPDDERVLARAVAEHLQIDLREVDGGPEILEELPRLTAAVGLPLGDPSMLAVARLARVASEDGVRVMLSGEGADEHLLGYARHRAVRRLQWVPGWLRGLVPAPASGMGRSSRLRRAFASRHGYESLLEASPPDFQARVLDVDPGFWNEPLSGGAGLRGAWTKDRLHYLPEDLLPKLDTATMAAGIEGRCPFLDQRFLRSAAVDGVPLRQRLGKRALRDAFADKLPPGHFDAPKRGFAVPLDRWWREDDFLADIAMDPRTLQRGWVREAGLKRIVDDQRAGRVAYGHALFLVCALELWERWRESPA